MNLGGIKVSSAEIERVINRLEGVVESAAVAVTPSSGGPSELVVVVVPSTDDVEALHAQVAQAVRSDLNPLFRVTKTVALPSLPDGVEQGHAARAARRPEGWGVVGVGAAGALSRPPGYRSERAWLTLPLSCARSEKGSA